MLYGGTVDPFMGRHPWLKASTGSLLLTHPVDVVGTRKGAGADFLGIALDRPFDRGPELAEPLDEFRHPRRQPEHVLEHQNLTVAGHAGAEPLGRRITEQVAIPTIGIASSTTENAPASATARA